MLPSVERRRYLQSLSTGLTAALAGCSGRLRSSTEIAATPVSMETVTTAPPGAAAGEVDLPVPKRQLQFAGFKDSIPAITEPAFAEDWSDVELELQQQALSPEFEFESEPRLQPTDAVIGLERGGAARAYPLRVLNWYEVVNDDFPADDGTEGPILVTYCPLCRTGIAAERVVRDTRTQFGVSGRLYRDNLVLYDELTSSLWSQVRAQAIRGPMTGERLTLVPATLTSWDDWRRQYPGTTVLLPPPISKTVHGRVVRDVTKSPYGDYENATRLGVGPGVLGDERLHPKAIVVGIRSGDVVRAYPLEAVRAAGGVVNDVVGERPVVVAAAADMLVGYDRRVAGEVRTFERTGGDHLVAGGSRWAISSGRAVDGPHRGRELTPASSTSAMFWFAWLQFNPETEVWTPDSPTVGTSEGR